VISRLRRLFFPAVGVSAREVEGPPPPRETRIRTDLREIRFEPETPNVVFEAVTAHRLRRG
jgi:hypothetical protein